MTKPKVFKSMAELRQHFFPDKFKREQELEKVSTILDEAKYDQVRVRRLTQDEIADYVDGKMNL